MEPVQSGVELISGGTGVSIQVIVAVVGGAMSFGIGALIWIDKRISGAAKTLADKIETLDGRYRDDHLVIVERITRLESSPYEWRQRHAANGGG